MHGLCAGRIQPVLLSLLPGAPSLSGRLRGLARQRLEPKIDEFLRLFSLWDDRNCPVSAYSKGMRQKISLSAALLHDPEILILDEPLSGLDVNTMIVIRELLHREAARGKMIFYSSHVLEVVEKVCTRVLILRRGVLIADDSVSKPTRLDAPANSRRCIRSSDPGRALPARWLTVLWRSFRREPVQRQYRGDEGTTFELVRHFLAHIFDSELLPLGGRGPERYWQRVAVSAFALAVPFGLVVLDPPYLHGGGAVHVHSPALMREVAAMDQLALITLVCAVTGLIGLLSWESLFPSRGDYLLLAGLPVRPRQVFLARFLTMLLFAAGLMVAINILPAFLTAHQFTVKGDSGVSPLSGVAARLISSCLGCEFVFFSLVALQGVLLNLLPRNWFTRVSTRCQGVLVCVFILAGLYTFFIVGWNQNDIKHVADFRWAPPLWFAATFRVMTGDLDPFWAGLAKRAYVAAAVAPGLATLAYPD